MRTVTIRQIKESILAEMEKTGVTFSDADKVVVRGIKNALNDVEQNSAVERVMSHRST